MILYERPFVANEKPTFLSCSPISSSSAERVLSENVSCTRYQRTNCSPHWCSMLHRFPMHTSHPHHPTNKLICGQMTHIAPNGWMVSNGSSFSHNQVKQWPTIS